MQYATNQILTLCSLPVILLSTEICNNITYYTTQHCDDDTLRIKRNPDHSNL